MHSAGLAQAPTAVAQREEIKAEARKWGRDFAATALRKQKQLREWLAHARQEAEIWKGLAEGRGVLPQVAPQKRRRLQRARRRLRRRLCRRCGTSRCGTGRGALPCQVQAPASPWRPFRGAEEPALGGFALGDTGRGPDRLAPEARGRSRPRCSAAGPTDQPQQLEAEARWQSSL